MPTRIQLPDISDPDELDRFLEEFEAVRETPRRKSESGESEEGQGEKTASQDGADSKEEDTEVPEAVHPLVTSLRAALVDESASDVNQRLLRAVQGSFSALVESLDLMLTSEQVTEDSRTHLTALRDLSEQVNSL